jgi:ElaB/YqjD/DUF883 family membrane-anchored ribosome-binding protein
MESNKNLSEQNQPQGSLNKPIGSQNPSGTTGRTTASAPQRAREAASDLSSGVQNAYDQTVKAVEGAYEKTSEVLSSTYNQTMTYGRDNPGKLTLIAFGAGIGIGLLLSSGLGGSRNRSRRFAEPVVNALSEVAMEFFRYR